ncbi:MAG: hypothetical protein ABJF10_00450 [Chthoniobacter sp.]
MALFAGTVFAAGAFAWGIRRQSAAVAVITALVLATNNLGTLYASALSEGLFLLVGLCGQLALLRGLERRSQPMLALAGALFGISALTRYSGVVWIGAGIACPLLWFPGRMLARVKAAAVVAAPSLLLVGALFLHNRLSSGSAAHRSFGFHLISKSHITEAFSTIPSWFLPDRFANVGTGAVVALVVAVLIAAAARSVFRGNPGADRAESRSARLAFGTALVFLLLYTAHLFIAISLLHFNTPLDYRLLAPVQLIVLLLLPPSIAEISGSLLATTGGRWLAGAVAAVFLLVSTGRATNAIEFTRREGRGFHSVYFQKCALVTSLRSIPASIILYSNKPEAIEGALDRRAVPLPFKENPMTLLPNAQLPEDLTRVTEQLQSGHALLVYFFEEGLKAPPETEPPTLSRRHQFNEKELLKLLPLAVQQRTKEGAIYRFRKSDSEASRAPQVPSSPAGTTH